MDATAIEKLFEQATRKKVKFPYKGQIGIEDLWDLRVVELDTLFKALNKRLKDTQEESLLATRTPEDKLLELQVALIRHIVEVKQQEAADREQTQIRAAKRQKLLALIAEKEDESLLALSTDELKKMAEEL